MALFECMFRSPPSSVFSVRCRHYHFRLPSFLPFAFHPSAHPFVQAVKAAGLCRKQGKAYIMQDGDIVHFNVNTKGIAKKKTAEKPAKK